MYIFGLNIFHNPSRIASASATKEGINAERDIRINESKRKADKKLTNGSLEEGADILIEDVPDLLEN